MTDPSEMQKADVEPFWAEFREGETALYLNDSDGDGAPDSDGDPDRVIDGFLTGVLMDKQTNVGPNDSRLYTLKSEADERPIKFWGSSHINSQIDRHSLGAGDEIAIQLTGETRETQRGDMDVYDVRFSR